MEEKIMTNTALKNKEIESKEKIAAEDRQASIQNSKRAAASGIAGSLIKGLGGNILNKFGKVRNPIEIYTNLGAGVADSIATIPSNFDLGQLLEDVDIVSYTANESGFLPQVFVLPYLPTIGRQQSRTLALNAINIGSTRQMTQLRKLNSRIGTYEPGDIVQVELASIDIASALQYASRVLKCVNVTSTANTMLQKLLVQAHGFSYSDIKTNVKQYRADLNLLIDRFNNNISVPNALPLATRRLMLSKYIILDGSEENRQLVIPAQVCFGAYDESSATISYQEGVVQPCFINSHKYMSPQFPTLGDFLTYIDVAMSRLEYSSVLVTMYADLSAAVGGNTLKLPTITATDLPEFVISDDIGDQIRNATLWKMFSNNPSAETTDIDDIAMSGAFDIKQDATGLLYQGYNADHPDTTSTWHPTASGSYNGSPVPVIPIATANRSIAAVTSLATLSTVDNILNVDNSSLGKWIVEPCVFKYEAKGYNYTAVIDSQPYTVICAVPYFTETPLNIIPLVPSEDDGVIDNDSNLLFADNYELSTIIGTDKVQALAIVQSFGYSPMIYICDDNATTGLGYSRSTPPFTNWHNPVYLPNTNLKLVSSMASRSLLQIIEWNNTFNDKVSNNHKKRRDRNSKSTKK